MFEVTGGCGFRVGLYTHSLAYSTSLQIVSVSWIIDARILPSVVRPATSHHTKNFVPHFFFISGVRVSLPKTPTANPCCPILEEVAVILYLLAAIQFSKVSVSALQLLANPLNRPVRKFL